MLTLHSFLQAVCLFVKSMFLRVTKRMHRTSSILMAGTAIVAVVTFSAQGFGGGGKNALAAPARAELAEEEEEEEPEESSFVTEAKIQFGLFNTGSESQQLTGLLLEENVRRQQQQRVQAQTEVEALKKQILKERQEAEARRAARRIQVSDEDYQVLLRIVQAEAGVCDDKGKILVADVVINRVLSGKFPGTVKEVVYQPAQFQPVSSGSINNVKVSAQTIACVDRALDGEDYSEGALYFMNRRVSGSRAGWFDRSLTYLFAHGGHEFFR